MSDDANKTGGAAAAAGAKGSEAEAKAKAEAEAKAKAEAEAKAKAEAEAKAKADAEPPAEPRVQSGPALFVGKKAKHTNGHVFEVEAILSEGVKLKGVANLVHPSALRPVE